MNRGKRSLAIDLQSEDGLGVLHRLLETCDVLIANFRPGVMRRLKLDYASLSARFPKLIYVSITAFGEEGPLAKKPAMDIIVQAAGGVMGLTGERGGSPVKVGAPIADYVGSYLAFSAISLALYTRAVHGFGQPIEINLLSGQISMLANFIPGHARNGEPKGPQGTGHPQIVPYQSFETKDGHIVIGCLTDQFWEALCDALELGELKADRRFATNPERVKHRNLLLPLLCRRIAEFTTSDLLPLLEARGVPCGEINSLADLAASEQIKHTNILTELEHPKLGSIRVVGNPLGLKKTPPRLGKPAPFLGEHNEEILNEIGWRAIPPVAANRGRK